MMKKLLFLLLILPYFAISQQIRFEDFNGLTAGNIAGQSTWSTFLSAGTPPTTTTNSSEANLQVTANGISGTQGFTITGPDGDRGSSFAWNEGFPAAWSARTSGNDIIEVEISVNPGGMGSASFNDFGVYIYNSAYNKVLAGITIDHSTNAISLVAYSMPEGQLTPNNFRYGLGLMLTENVFSRYGFSYNTVTGEVLIDGDGIDDPLSLDTNVATDTPAEIDFFAFSGSTNANGPNTVASSMIFDDFVVRASATNTLLNTTDFVQNSTSLYPNPAYNEITLTSNYSIQDVQFFNNLGQMVLKRINLGQEAKFDISELKSGMYFMTINSEDGKSETKKFIKN